MSCPSGRSGRAAGLPDVFTVMNRSWPSIEKAARPVPGQIHLAPSLIRRHYSGCYRVIVLGPRRSD
jgi:hypothetical protein